MKPHVFIGALLVLVAGTASRAQGIVSYVASLPAATVTSNSAPRSINLPGFDSSLGTLTQVQLTYFGEVWQTLKSENLDSVSRSYDLTNTVSLSVSRSTGEFLFVPPPVVMHDAGTLGAFDSHVDFGGTSGIAFNGYQPLTLSAVDSSLARYITSGLLTFNATALASSTLSGSGNLASQAASSAATRLTIDYTYSAIPEPSAGTACLGLAVLGVILSRTGRSAIIRFRRHWADGTGPA